MALSLTQEQSTRRMSIWINSAAGALAFAGLAACSELNIAAPNPAVSVQGGDIKVAPPAGYCANPKASTDATGSAVVLMGRCSATSTTAPALITASVGAAGSGAALDAGPVALTRFFTSDQGRAMLASTGRTADAVLLASEAEDTSLLLRVKDATLGEYWRAILALKGRLVMLSATGAQGVSLPQADGRALLSKTMTSLRRANPETAKGGLFAQPAHLDKALPAEGVRPQPRPSVPTSG
jgi:hypothetical protein